MLVLEVTRNPSSNKAHHLSTDVFYGIPRIRRLDWLSETSRFEDVPIVRVRQVLLVVLVQVVETIVLAG